jgi:hypothetical protein
MPPQQEIDELFDTNRARLEKRADTICAGMLVDLQDGGHVVVSITPRRYVLSAVPPSAVEVRKILLSDPPPGHIHVLVQAGTTLGVRTMRVPPLPTGQE